MLPVRFDPMAPAPFAQPQPSGAHGSPTVAGMPDVSNWASLLPKAPTAADQLKQQAQGRQTKATTRSRD